MNRRAFLSVLAGSPLVFGLRELLAQEPAGKAVPEWYRAALKRMKETHRYGIVIVVPDDPKERERWGKALIDRYNEFYSDRHEPFGAVVLICITQSMTAALPKEAFMDDKKVVPPNSFLLRPDGTAWRCGRMAIGTAEEPGRFESSLTSLAYGPQGAHLAEQAAAIEKTLSDPVRKSAAELSEGGKYPPEAAAGLLEKADAILPWIVHKCREAEAKVPDGECKPPPRIGLRNLLTQYWTRQSLIENDPCLPYGVKVEALPAEDPCPPCGRAMISPGRARKFLSFFEK